MKIQQCSNCGEYLDNKFCPACGQKADTHRITLERFIAHDLIHGVWHFEKGMLFTIKEALMRPGQAALDYIRGKRIRYYNVFYLSLVLIGLNALLIHFLRPYRTADGINQSANTLFAFLSDYAKVLVFAIVPVLAINAKLMFRRLKLNIAEHFIVAGMCLIGIMLSSIVCYLFDFGTDMTGWNLLGIMELMTALIVLLYPVWTYWNVTMLYYTKPGRLWRVFIFYIFLLVELIIALLLITYLLTGDFSISMIV